MYFPDNRFYIYIDAKLNDWRTCKVIDDKSMYDIYFADIYRPRTIARCCNGTWLNDKYEIIDKEKVINLCYDSGRVIIKPFVSSSGGHGIEFWEKGNNDLSGLLGLHYFKNCVIQEIIEQHAELSSIHPDSVNTIRIMTILMDNNVKILSSVLRMGVGKANVDNVSSGGVACGIDENGCLRQNTYNAKGQCWDGHPDGYSLKGVKVPSFEECCIICKRIAPRFTRFANLVSWDFAIDKMGRPVLIEANLHGGELDFHQMCNGPIFGDELTTKKMIDCFCK